MAQPLEEYLPVNRNVFGKLLQTGKLGGKGSFERTGKQKSLKLELGSVGTAITAKCLATGGFLLE